MALRHLLTLDDGCETPESSENRVSGREPCVHITSAGITRPFVEGEVLTFDDSFWHEVSSSGPADKHRLIFMVETANPLVLPCGGAGETTAACRESWWPYGSLHP